MIVLLLSPFIYSLSCLQEDQRRSQSHYDVLPARRAACCLLLYMKLGESGDWGVGICTLSAIWHEGRRRCIPVSHMLNQCEGRGGISVRCLLYEGRVCCRLSDMCMCRGARWYVGVLVQSNSGPCQASVYHDAFDFSTIIIKQIYPGAHPYTLAHTLTPWHTPLPWRTPLHTNFKLLFQIRVVYCWRSQWYNRGSGWWRHGEWGWCLAR